MNLKHRPVEKGEITMEPIMIKEIKHRINIIIQDQEITIVTKIVETGVTIEESITEGIYSKQRNHS